jgi:hypothetical protein
LTSEILSQDFEGMTDLPPFGGPGTGSVVLALCACDILRSLAKGERSWQGSSSEMVQLTRAMACVIGAVVVLIAGCGSTPLNVAPRFYGAWVNADPRSNSWLEVEAHRVVSFGLTPSNGRCAATAIDIVAKDRVTVPVSSLGSGDMTLRLDGRALVVTGKFATQRFVQSSRESICQLPGGTYLPGAPYSKQRS